MLRLRELRKKCGITMKELGATIGVAESTISQYETGKRQPDYETLLKLGEYFGVSTDYLLGNSAPTETADVLDAVDVAFYGEYKELDEEQKATVRDMVKLMRERRLQKQEKK